MCQPAAARAWAVARPMPRLDAAPVTMAVLSVTDMVVLSGPGGSGWGGPAAVGQAARGGGAAGGGRGRGGGWRGGGGGGGSAPQGARALPPSSVLIRVTTASVDRP